MVVGVNAKMLGWLYFTLLTHITVEIRRVCYFYQEKAQSRRGELFQFAHSEDLPNSLALACISSIPRWHVARSLFTDKNSTSRKFDKLDETVGIYRGLKSCVADTAYIVDGCCSVARNFLLGVENADRVRAQVLRTLLRTVVYLRN